MRIRLEGVPHRYHEDHLSAKGIKSLSHYNLVHKFVPMPQALKNRMRKEREKLEKIPAWQLTNVRNKKEVIEGARKKSRTVHFASVMDVSHLQNSELKPQYQKYRGRVVLRGDIVKDDSGAKEVFTEQGSSVSQMTAAKVMDIIFKTTRMRRTSSRCSIRLHQGQNGRCTDVIENSKVRMSRYLDMSTRT